MIASNDQVSRDAPPERRRTFSTSTASPRCRAVAAASAASSSSAIALTLLLLLAAVALAQRSERIAIDGVSGGDRDPALRPGLERRGAASSFEHGALARDADDSDVVARLEQTHDTRANEIVVFVSSRRTTPSRTR